MLSKTSDWKQWENTEKYLDPSQRDGKRSKKLSIFSTPVYNLYILIFPWFLFQALQAFYSN